MESSDSGTPGNQPGSGKPAAEPRKGRWGLMLAVFLAAAVVGFFLFRRPPVGSEGGPSAGTGSATEGLVVATTVKLNAKSAMIADRYNCMCGDCSDRLGACTCVHQAGANEMKAFLNELVESHDNLDEIDAAMVEKYGDQVLALTSESPK